MPKKLSGCGFVVRVDLSGGSTFTTVGLVDSISPWGRSKVVIETPTLDCTASAEVGREEQSTISFTQYYDPQDADMVAFDTNFVDSLTDPDVKDITVQLVTPSYSTDGVAAAAAVTEEATCQIQEISREDLTPEGYYKRTVTMLRKSDITRTVA
jgi:hypothetical protein